MGGSHRLASMDAEAVGGLMKVLRVLESCGGAMDVDQVWNDCYPIPEMEAGPGSVRSQTLLRVKLKPSLKELGHLLDALDHLTSSLQKRISSLKAVYELLFLSHWMDTAPVEVLDNIFEETCSGSHWAAWNLSQVNKPFYKIVTQNPRLWSNISNLDTEVSYEELRVILERSKNTGLNVEMEFQDFKIMSGVDILHMASPEASRWENVIYSMEYQEQEDWQELFGDIYEYSADLDLPRLRSAELHYPRERELDEEEHEHIIDHSEPLMHFYATWSVPNLVKLTVINLFPRPFLRLTPPLTVLELEVDEDDPLARVYDMNLLLKFLRSSPLLETLCLKFDLVTPSTIHDDRTLPETVLPNVRIFRFTTLYMSSQSLLPFMKALRLPILRELYVHIEPETYDPATGGQEWVDFIFPLPRGHYTNVEVFSYTFMEFPLYDDAHCPSYNIPFIKLPNLRSLTLEMPLLCPDMNYRDTYMDLPTLREVHFVRCYVLGYKPLRLFRKALEKQDKWDTLKEVTFTECRSLKKEGVETIFQGKIVTWVP